VQRDGQPDGDPTAEASPGTPGGEDTPSGAAPVLDVGGNRPDGDAAVPPIEVADPITGAAPATVPVQPPVGSPLADGSGPYPPPYPPPPYPQPPYPPSPYPVPQSPPSPPRRSGTLPPVPPRTHRWGLGAYLLAEAVFLLVSAGLAYLIQAFWAQTAGSLALMVLVPTLCAAATALLITRLRGNGPRIDLGIEWSWRDVGVGAAFGVSGLVLTIPASLIYISIVGPEATSAVGEVFGDIRSGPVLAVVVLLAVVVVGPACEEILYRGLLWGGVERLAGRWAAFGVSTLLFALAHFEFQRTPLLLVVAIPIALARLYTGRLLASIVAHQINNLLPGIALALGLLGVLPMT
jgi:membrane protease YdiL (CAAX protease family)